MTLGELIIRYRTEHNLSQRAFALKCGLSNGYIAMLERNVNPQTGRPIVPGLKQVKVIAEEMGMTLDQLIRSIDGETRVKLSDTLMKIENMPAYNVPLIGSVAAGEPILAEESFQSYVPSPVKADYALIIKGDSMDPTYLDGDVVYIRQQPDVDYEGQVAVVLLDDTATVKHVYKQSDGLLLVSDNPTYKPMYKRFADFDNMRILGKVVGFTRIYDEVYSHD